MANEKRLIDANAMEQVFCNGIDRVLKSVASTRAKEVAKITLEWCVSKLSKAPTVDAVEVVRCKDCIHWGYVVGCGHYCECYANQMADTEADDFCSYGERRSDG